MVSPFAGRTAATAILAALTVTSPALAQSDDPLTAPYQSLVPFTVEWEIYADVEADQIIDSEDPDVTPLNVTTTVEPAVTVHLPYDFSVSTSLVLEQIEDPDSNDAAVLERHGVYMDTLYAQWAPGDFSLLAGKFGPTFGQAWDRTPGVFGTDLAEDYELSEQIGGAVAYSFATEGFGEHTLTANLFMTDRTLLSGSLITDRDTTSLRDGGAGNTEAPQSVSLTWDAADLAGVEGLELTAGYRVLAEGDEDDGATEHGGVLGVYYATELDNGWTVEPLAEVAHFQNAAGLDDTTATYLTVGAGAGFDRYSFAASYTGRFIRSDDEGDFNDTLAQASVGYDLGHGAGVELGYAFADGERVESHVLGLVFSYELGGSASF